jgi:hypothetical protein
MNHLELFSGTHSFGKVSSSLGYNVVSLDRDLGAECPFKSGYKSAKHFQEDILSWNYVQYPKHYFKLITASPVCMWWSRLRNTWIGRKLKAHGDEIITKEIIQQDIENYGIPMVDKIFEILDYFDPEFFIIENPTSGKMKNYINELIPFYDIDYCKYSNFGYKKTTRFWTNIKNLKFESCNNDCKNMVDLEGQHIHKDRMGTSKTVLHEGKIIRVNTAELRKKYKDFPNMQSKKHKICIGGNEKGRTIGGGNNRLERYRIPAEIIKLLLNGSAPI